MTTSKNKVVKILVLSLALIMLLGALTVGAFPNLMRHVNTNHHRERTYEMGQFAILNMNAHARMQIFSTRVDVRRNYRVQVTQLTGWVTLLGTVGNNTAARANTGLIQRTGMFCHTANPSTHSDGWYHRSFHFVASDFRNLARANGFTMNDTFNVQSISQITMGGAVMNPSGRTTGVVQFTPPLVNR